MPLNRIMLRGFRSIREMDLELRPLNVLVGVNGAGKSNLVSFFKMLNEMMEGRLQKYVAGSGRAQAVLHFGPKVTLQIESRLEFGQEYGIEISDFRLFHAAGDTLVFAEERVKFRDETGTSTVADYRTGHLESRLGEADRGSTDCYQRVEALERALAEELQAPRFMPCLQLHEFEALLLAEPSALAGWFEGVERAVESLIAECRQFDSPERIDEGQLPKSAFPRFGSVAPVSTAG